MIDARFYTASLCFFLIACSAPDTSEHQIEYDARYPGIALQLKSLEPAGASAIIFDAVGELAEINVGYANAERGQKFNGTTRVSIGELSEIFISALIMYDMERGNLDIDKPFGQYLEVDQLASSRPAELRIRESTIREMLYQGTGIRANFSLMLRGYDPSIHLEQYLPRALVIHEPQVARIPSSALIDMLGLFVASRKKSDLAAYSERLIFKPLRMRSASYGRTEGDALYAVHYKYGQQLPEFEEPSAPSNSFVADSHDLVRFFRIFLPGGTNGKRRILSPASIADMLSSQSPSIKKNQGVAVGLTWLLDPPGLSFLGNGAWYAGKYLGHRTCVMIFPDRGIGALAVTNAWAWDAKETLYDICSSFLTQYASETLGITKPSGPEVSSRPIPEDLRIWIDGTYASELGLVRLNLVEQVLKVTFEGITNDLHYVKDTGFVSLTNNEIQIIKPAGIGSVDIQFASGFISPSSLKLTVGGCPTSWASLPGVYRKTDGDAALPYALQIRLENDFYLISGGDGREYVLIPKTDGAAQIVCSSAAVLFGKQLYISESGSIRLESCVYKK